MRNFIQPGNSLAIAVPYAGGVLAGQGVLVGALFGVAATCLLYTSDAADE